MIVFFVKNLKYFVQHIDWEKVCIFSVEYASIYFMTLFEVSDWLLLRIPSSKNIEAAAENFLFNKIFSDSVLKIL